MNKLEAWGLLLILFSFGWQILEEHIAVLSSQTDKYQLHVKLDLIWLLIVDEYYQNQSDKAYPRSVSDIDSLNKNWKYWSELIEEKERVTYQSKVFSGIRIILYLAGSILILVPKFREPKVKTDS